MTDFRILEESTFNLKGGKLYLMLLRENGKFGIEVVNREKTFGRKYTDSQKKANLLFDIITNKLSVYTTLADAENCVIRCFSLKSVNKLMFILTADGKETTQGDIQKLREEGIIEFKMDVQFGFLKDKKKKDAISIYISETRHSKPYGVLFGMNDGNLKMTFELL